MVIDPREFRRALPPTQISEHTPCRFCGYDLVGLMSNGTCPECGKPIRPKHALRLGTDQMVDAPLPYLRLLSLGATLMLGGWLALMITLGVLVSTGSTIAALAYTASALTWWTGVVVVTRPRPPSETTSENRLHEWLRLRIASRFTQAFWILSAGMLFAWITTGGGGGGGGGGMGGADWALALAWAAGAVGSFGFVPLTLFLANLLDWAADSTGTLLRRLVVLVPAAPLTCLFIVGSMIPTAWGFLHGWKAPVVLVLLVMFVVLIIPPLAYTWCLVCFQRTCSWAITNHHAADERLERLRERAMQEAQRGGLPATGVDPTTLPGFNLATSSEVAPQPTRSLAPGNRAKGLSKKKSADPNPYELSED